MTQYVVNTALDAGWTTQNTLDITYLLKQYLNLTVTTDNIGLLVPEILTKYGSGKAVSISGKFAKAAASSKFTDAGASIDGSLLVNIAVGGETAISAEFDDISGAADINSHSGKVFGDISKASLGSISKFTTSLGITKDALMSDLQGKLDTGVQQANTILKAGWVIPKILGIDVSDVEIDFTPGLMKLGLSVSSNTWESAARVLNGRIAVADDIPESIALIQ